MENKLSYIAVFDSGIGGLTVLKELKKEFPNESFVYFGDNARCPYGGKSEDAIREYTNQIVNFLLVFDVKAIVIACNTITALCYEELRDRLSIPVIGVIEAGVNLALEHCHHQKIGIMGTITTIQSSMYKKTLQEKQKNIQVFEQATPLLVPIIERGTWGEEEHKQFVQSLFPFQLEDVGMLIMGCTHYPIMEEKIHRFFKGNVELINPAIGVIKEVRKMVPLGSKKREKDKYFTTGDVHAFHSFAKSWLQEEVQVRQVHFQKKIRRMYQHV